MTPPSPFFKRRKPEIRQTGGESVALLLSVKSWIGITEYEALESEEDGSSRSGGVALGGEERSNMSRLVS